MLKIAFFGAGQVNFGGGEGPWNHAKRLEMLCGSLCSADGHRISLSVVGIYDLHTRHAERVLERQKQLTKIPELWKDTVVFDNCHEMLDTLEIDAVFIGVPPESHGSSLSPNDIEMQCAQRGIHMFVEKPLSCHELCDVSRVASRVASVENLVVSVGYMFRYSEAIRRMKSITEMYGAPRMFIGRYTCAYTNLAKEMWWDTKKSGGPIVEQATHFCDIARFLMGEVNIDSVQATSIKQNERLGQLQLLPENISNLEDKLPDERKTPRVTSAFWKFQSGAIGSLTHGVLLHGNSYESEIEVWGDGYKIVLSDPYHKCELRLRLPGSEETIVEMFGTDDPYLEEDKVFLEAVLSGSTDKIASTYEDAYHTYKFSWKIRTQSEM